jgi:CheY-like chemotaxis protein
VARETAPPAEPPAAPAAQAPVEAPVEPVIHPIDPIDPPATTELVPVIDLDRPPLRVLVVEDNPFDLATLETLLEPYETTEVVVTHAATRAEGQKLVLGGEFDVVLLDLDLPDSKGVTTVLEWHHEVNLGIPVIATASEAGADLIGQVRALGVIHVVLKPHLDELAAKGGTGSRQLLKLLRTTAQRRAQIAPTTSF